MKVLGIDPGTHRVGWGIIEGNISSQKALDYGCIELPKHTIKSDYLQVTYSHINKILDLHKPTLVGIEHLFFQKNKKTAIQVAQSRGVILLALAQHNLIPIELTPNTIKATVAGSGRASKDQVETMVGMLLSLDSMPDLDDTTDALATAITALILKGKDDLIS